MNAMYNKEMQTRVEPMNKVHKGISFNNRDMKTQSSKVLMVLQRLQSWGQLRAD